MYCLSWTLALDLSCLLPACLHPFRPLPNISSHQVCQPPFTLILSFCCTTLEVSQACCCPPSAQHIPLPSPRELMVSTTVPLALFCIPLMIVLPLQDKKHLCSMIPGISAQSQYRARDRMPLPLHASLLTGPSISCLFLHLLCVEHDLVNHALPFLITVFALRKACAMAQTSPVGAHFGLSNPGTEGLFTPGCMN